MIFLQVETTDVLTPIVALASSFIAAIVTLAVAMLRFGLGRHNPTSSSISKTDLDNAVTTICAAVNGLGTICGTVQTEIAATRQQAIGNGALLAEIKGGLHNPGEDPK